MGDKLGLGSEVRELKIGQSFTNPKSTAFHTVRYDFKPASVDLNKKATVEVGNNNQVTLTVPHLDGAGVPLTVFKGSQRPFNKECVLIIDKITGEITLEKLAANIQVKKTRTESMPKPQLHPSSSTAGPGDNNRNNTGRPQTPPIGQRTSSKTKVTSGSRRPERQITHHLVPKHSPLHASPTNYPSPNHPTKSPKRDVSRDLPSMTMANDMHAPHGGNNLNHHSGGGAGSLPGSLPMIGLDDYYPDNTVVTATSVAATAPPPPLPTLPQIHIEKSPGIILSDDNNEIGGATSHGVEEMSDSTSSSSSSDSDSDSGHSKTVIYKNGNGSLNGHTNGLASHGGGPINPITNPKMSTSNTPAAHILSEDLRLSESGSDSD